MKRLIVFALSVFTGFGSFGQYHGEIGFFVGGQGTTAHYAVRNIEQPTQYKFGPQAGISFKVPFETKLFFVPTMYYSMKGYKVTLNDPAFPPSTLAKNNNTTIHTVDIGVFLQYDFSGEHGFFVKAGPAIESAFSGKEEFELLDGNKVEQAMKFGNQEYGRFSASMVLQAGYETPGGFMIFGHYTYGMTSINNHDGGPKIRHRLMGLSVGKYLRR